MLSWSSRRRISYLSSVLLVILVFVGGIYLYFFYHKPTCFDGIKNSGEFGIDCGGRCVILCQTAFIPAEVDWARVDFLSDGYYNVGAYIKNHNIDSFVKRAHYIFRIYDDKGIIINEKEGYVYIPPHKNTLAFERAVSVGKRTPVKVTFDFIESPFWEKYTGLDYNLTQINPVLSDKDTAPKLSVALKNDTLDDYRNIDVFAILKDIDGNTISFSRTAIDKILNGESKEAVFTWSSKRDREISSFEIIPVITPITSK
ncbi:MAG: hypothetical protein Q7R78_02790 [bacterium]|nr:hypothetical protein [bacterium]